MSEKLLPDLLKKDKRLVSFAKLEEEVFNDIAEKIPYLFIYKLETLSDEELEEFAWQFDISKEQWQLAVDRKQKEDLIRNNILLKAKRGTPFAIKRVFKLLGLEGEVQEWYEYNGQPYRFKVELGINNREITEQLRDKLINLVNEYKNLRSHLEEIKLTYLTKTSIYTLTGTMAEATADAQMIDGFTVNSIGNVYVSSGTMAETSSYAKFVEV